MIAPPGSLLVREIRQAANSVPLENIDPALVAQTVQSVPMGSFRLQTEALLVKNVLQGQNRITTTQLATVVNQGRLVKTVDSVLLANTVQLVV